MALAAGHYKGRVGDRVYETGVRGLRRRRGVGQVQTWSTSGDEDVVPRVHLDIDRPAATVDRAFRDTTVMEVIPDNLARPGMHGLGRVGGRGFRLGALGDVSVGGGFSFNPGDLAGDIAGWIEGGGEIPDIDVGAVLTDPKVISTVVNVGWDFLFGGDSSQPVQPPEGVTEPLPLPTQPTYVPPPPGRTDPTTPTIIYVDRPPPPEPKKRRKPPGGSGIILPSRAPEEDNTMLWVGLAVAVGAGVALAVLR